MQNNSKIEFYGEVNDMEKWGEFEFNAPYFGETIEKINDVVLPKDYIEFMKKHNGGEGDIGETWLVLYPLEELQEITKELRIQKDLTEKEKVRSEKQLAKDVLKNYCDINKNDIYVLMNNNTVIKL